MPGRLGRWALLLLGFLPACAYAQSPATAPSDAGILPGWCADVAQRLSPRAISADVDAAKRAIRTATAMAAPAATAEQARHYGFQLPPRINPHRPLVVLVRGLDMENRQWAPMANLLAHDGQQVALFGYPGDGPIADDAALLCSRMAILHAAYPTLKINLIAFSMGSLVSRAYVEGDHYLGNVDHLILIAPPNHGSSWAHFEVLLKARHQYEQYEHDPDWRPSWIVTEGLGEAARDLLPDSQFLDSLNALPRRPGVRYTIIRGEEPVIRRMAADALSTAMADLPTPLDCWPSVRTCRLAATVTELGLRCTPGTNDGPVSLDSAALPGVSDVVTLQADHETLYLPTPGGPPTAWPIIRQRLRE